ncbi:MAG: hypothetical protein F4X02_08255 [Chloroflexi bacterium]|nr:hypothetical protein [Chloroflexota bacterium]
MTSAPDIVGIGVCTVDHLVTVPRMPLRNENMRALNYARQPGGLASCSLVAAARLGARTRIIARIGDDALGEYIRQDLRSEGVDVSLLLEEAGSESHVSVILVDERTGDRSIITRPPTGSAIRPTEITRADLEGAQVLFVDNITTATLQLAAWAREAGMKVVLDPAQPYADIKPLLALVDVPIVPEHWARAWLPGQPPEAAARRLFDAGAEIAVVTLGERGAAVCWDGGLRRFPAYAVDVVDTTGAGDAYHGAFMYALLQGWDVPRMADFASAVGSLNCRAMGGRSALPTRAEVDQFMLRANQS